jgi:hypothetical protein
MHSFDIICFSQGFLIYRLILSLKTFFFCRYQVSVTCVHMTEDDIVD